LKSGDTYPRNTALAFLLAGNPGAGKTVACFAFPDPFILDCEGNLKSGIERNPGKKFWWDSPERKGDGTSSLPHECWLRAEELLKEAGTKPEVKTLVVDGLGRIALYLKDYLVYEVSRTGEKLPKIAGQLQMSQSLWGEYARKMGQFAIFLRSFNKPVVVTCHLKVDENELSSVKEQRVDIQGGSANSYAKNFTDFYHLMASPNSDGKYTKTGGVRYFIRTAPTSRIELKSHNNQVIPAEMELTDEAFKKLIASLA
jgi:hypothetical protein